MADNPLKRWYDGDAEFYRDLSYSHLWWSRFWKGAVFGSVVSYITLLAWRCLT